MFEKVDPAILPFSWRQQAEFFKVIVPLPNPNLKSKDLIVDVSSKHIRAEVRGGDLFVDIDLAIEIIPTDNDWSIKRGHIVFKLTKQSPIDLKFSFNSPIQFSNQECTEFKEQPAPLQHETKSDYFKLVKDDIVNNHLQFLEMCRDFERSQYPDDMDEQTRQQKAEEIYNRATKEEDISEVYNLYKAAADLGHAQSRELFAKLCLIEEDNDFGIVPSPQQAFEYMKKAAIENGSHTALFQLGNYFMKGIGTEKSYENALICFTEHSIKDGNPTSMFNIGVLYHEGGSIANIPFNKDYKKAFAWWKLALNRGHALSAYNIGILLKSGDGVDKSLVKAFQYFKLANFMSEKIQIPTDVLIAIQEQQFNVFKGDDEPVAEESPSPTESNHLDEDEQRNVDFLDEKLYKKEQPEKNLLSEEEDEYVDEVLDITKIAGNARSPPTTSHEFDENEEEMEAILRQLSGNENNEKSTKSQQQTTQTTKTNDSTGSEPSVGWKIAEYALTFGAMIGIGYLMKRSTEFH
ncbi:hypothetical protein FDP41_003145 [Naegleria fowleri]|uniref:CS domain-containing protein n=1 Tax=Naegleria fowleri TaxID=5763 RepID=A0A6A5BIT5_NAEFO|nr:uncharacterized protein FDP41_003145 [Naegleria fowleri]KAF0977823.1 hypothetical protein FDP41_003145 [Naegleria fowleri]CAG4707744.1 unnamed protein product [Naegleria fowleri]